MKNNARNFPQLKRRKSQGRERDLLETLISRSRLDRLPERVGIEAVTDAAHRHDQFRVVVVALDLAAQTPD
jgi:hypothetical protein